VVRNALRTVPRSERGDGKELSMFAKLDVRRYGDFRSMILAENLRNEGNNKGLRDVYNKVEF